MSHQRKKTAADIATAMSVPTFYRGTGCSAEVLNEVLNTIVGLSNSVASANMQAREAVNSASMTRKRSIG